MSAEWAYLRHRLVRRIRANTLLKLGIHNAVYLVAVNDISEQPYFKFNG